MLSRTRKIYFELNILIKKVARLYTTTSNVPLKFNVPPLNQTLEKYSKYLKPLLSNNEWKHVNHLIRDFTKEKGEGHILQKLLEKKASKEDNWLNEWWLNLAYLENRNPLPINSNPGMTFPIKKFKNSDEWIEFSVKLLHGILEYKLLIDSNKLPRDYIKNDPLCMNQYYNLFSSCRIPGKIRDKRFSVDSHRLKKENRINYIVVVHKNRFFVMDVIDPETQTVYSEKSLFHGFCEIINGSQTSGVPMGLLTTENRNNWETSYARLNEIPINRHAFSILQKSIFLFCLDSSVFTNQTQCENSINSAGHNMLHGNGHAMNSANRWFDKTIQIIVSSDGACGLNYEHSAAEAVVPIKVINYTYRNINAPENLPIVLKPQIINVKEIRFDLDKQTMTDIDSAKTNLNRLIKDLDLNLVSFKEFGKAKLKVHKISPDAFIQMGIQLGYYNLHKHPGSTYETGSLRRFKLGRTDAIRSCSSELIDFCKSVNDSSVDISEQKRLLLLAIEQHSKYTNDVLNGQGIDRHLLGLKMIAIENRRNIPEVFMDTSYSKACHHVLSTSQTVSDIDLCAFYGARFTDAYGLYYNPRADKIHFGVTAMNSCDTTNALSLSNHVENAWRQIMNILEQIDP